MERVSTPPVGDVSVDIFQSLQYFYNIQMYCEVVTVELLPHLNPVSWKLFLDSEIYMYPPPWTPERPGLYSILNPRVVVVLHVAIRWKSGSFFLSLNVPLYSSAVDELKHGVFIKAFLLKASAH